MRNILLKIVGPISLTLISYGCHSQQKNPYEQDGYYISTQSQSNDRVKKLGLDKPSEDASYILNIRKLSIPNIKHDTTNTDSGINRNNSIKEFDKGAIIVLKSDTPLNGMKVWDVLQSVGLRWGDGDLFHWENPSRDYGDDQLFSVWTTTDPGYFLPESIKAGEMNPDNLIFGFSIPRDADPENVFEAMVKAIKYCQKRLGGKILDQNGQPFDEASERKAVLSIIKKMNDKGIKPGSDKALMMY